MTVFKVLRRLDDGLYSFCALPATHRFYDRTKHLLYTPGVATVAPVLTRPLFALATFEQALDFMRSYISRGGLIRGNSGFEMWSAEAEGAQQIYNLPSWAEDAEFWPCTVLCSSITIKERVK